MSNNSVPFIPSSDTCSAVTVQCPLSATLYGYSPNIPGNILFAVWFGILFFLGLGYGIRSKAWTFTLALGIGTGGEMLGYIGRLWMHTNPWNSDAFQMQISCLVIAPSFLAACIYLTLKHLVLHFGTEHSFMKASLYPWIFVGCDIGSILLQAVGGGIAASANDNKATADAGNSVMIAGISFQVVTMIVCGLFTAVYVFRYKNSDKRASLSGSNSGNPEKTSQDVKNKRKLAIYCSAVGVAYLAILIRSVYRIPELAGGWGGPLMRNENEFLFLDGTMVAIATFALTVFHPGFFFPVMGGRTTSPLAEYEMVRTPTHTPE